MAKPEREDSPDAAQRLAEYRRKRDFGRTPEPGGPAPDGGPVTSGTPAPDGTPTAPAPRFVVQRHRARRLHYDLRFEIDGVLVSWAVPKGPTLDPEIKRMAVHVEDHPIEYLNFEGVIPRGEYGGGDVIVWDRGTWEPHASDDPAAAVASGEFHADMFGEKLRGRLILVRRGHTRDGSQNQWLLFHKHDDFAVTGWDAEDHPRSVLSGRTNDEVKADPERMWRADLPPAQASVPVRPAPAHVSEPGPGHAPGAETPDAETPDAETPDGAGPAWPAPPTDVLAALDGLGKAGTWDVFGRRLRLTNLDKALFPGADGEPPVTKREFIRYAARIAPVVLPYLTGRALNMNRFPDGAGSPGFWHKQLPDHAPDWVPRWRNPSAGWDETNRYLVVDEPAALVWAANFGALEWHAWTSRTDEPRLPTYVLLDIDPGPATPWEDTLTLARLHRTALAHLGVRGQPKITGRRGIQIWVPIARGPSFDDTREWAHQLSKAIGSVVPTMVSWRWDVRERGGHARLDYTQNAINKTLVAPYSPRPAPGAPVSAPIDWDELDDPGLRPDGVTIRTVFDRLAQRGDPFRAVLTTTATLPPVA